MASYEALKASLNKNGEVMIRLDTGDKIELHTHDVKFEDSTREIVVDAGTETYWIGADRVFITGFTERVLKRKSKEIDRDEISNRGIEKVKAGG
jgi:hypothetical protein